MRLRWLDLCGPAVFAGTAVAAGQVRLALLPPLDQGGHEATAGRSAEQGCQFSNLSFELFHFMQVDNPEARRFTSVNRFIVGKVRVTLSGFG